jgi:hypothetical protein
MRPMRRWILSLPKLLSSHLGMPGSPNGVGHLAPPNDEPCHSPQ